MTAALSCKTPELARRSLAEFFGVTPDVLDRILGRLTPSECSEGETTPWSAISGCLTDDFPEPPWSFVFFHATRTLSAQRYTECGLLPLDQALPLLVADLRELIPDVADDQWSAFVEKICGGRAIPNVANRLESAGQRGTFGYLVREIAINPPDSDWPYTKCPETVFDLIEASPEEWGLKARFEECSLSAVVHFTASTSEKGYLASLADYVWSNVHNQSTAHLTDAFWTEGTPISAQDIIEIELIDAT